MINNLMIITQYETNPNFKQMPFHFNNKLLTAPVSSFNVDIRPLSILLKEKNFNYKQNGKKKGKW